MTNLNPIAAVTILHTVLMCGLIRILATLMERAVEYVCESVCVWCEVLDVRAAATFTFAVCPAGKVYL